ncbi:OmpA family protein [Flavobacterium alkalisoli]|uniref:OmpA family protein n=1 Tax=Flavobacterium alkalisoli TaxID=2602769 RepID=A0A5B9FMG1_9FLAO|nr:OmpA family protein [Flavobacterium alkalisoli]QEE48060.1 OmpA family protein [Flavobacterium alkalisoli]
MRILKYTGLLFILLLSCFQATAQRKELKKAKIQFDNYAYSDALETYLEVANTGYRSIELYEQIGDAYYFKGELDYAYQWYNKLFNLHKEVEPEYYYRYAQTLKFVGNADEADKMMNKFSELSSDDLRTKMFLDNKDYREQIEENSGRYEIKPMEVNSNFSDYGPAFYKDKIVFASSRDTINNKKKRGRVDRWTNEAFTGLYVTPAKEDDSLAGKVEKFSLNLDTKYHESTPVFTKDGNTVYFTRNNYNNGKVKKDDHNGILLKIYRAKFNGTEWTDVTELSFNSNDYSCAHPALSADERTLYFASNMPGTYGRSDIYRVSINGNGNFGMAENLGPGINTEGRESFPFVSDTDDLYFASEGHPGLGGLDIFVSKMEPDGNYIKAYNVGRPINSERDDFGLIFNAVESQGFFTTNRKGNDDIYRFKEIEEFAYECKEKLEGILREEGTGRVLANTKVLVIDEKKKVAQEAVTDIDGNYSFEVDCGKQYIVKADRAEEALAQNEVKKGSDLGKVFNIQYIYFDLGKYEIKPEAAKDLDKLVAYMKQNPNMKLDVRTHTDSRASHKYNQVLSDKRANSIIAYIIDHGVEAYRVGGRGYGETQLLSKCPDGVICSEEQHRLNRRCEFIITEM